MILQVQHVCLSTTESHIPRRVPWFSWVPHHYDVVPQCEDFFGLRDDSVLTKKHTPNELVVIALKDILIIPNMLSKFWYSFIVCLDIKRNYTALINPNSIDNTQIYPKNQTFPKWKPPIITIPNIIVFMAGMCTIPKWSVYSIGLPTLILIPVLLVACL